MRKFAVQSISVPFVVAAMLTMNLATAFAESNARTYRCTAKDAVGIESDGTVTKDDPGAKFKIKEFWRIVIDVQSGDISFPDSGTLEHRVVEKAAASGDYVLLPRNSFQFAKAPANATTDFIRIRAGADRQPATFRAYSLNYLVTGTCEIVP